MTLEQRYSLGGWLMALGGLIISCGLAWVAYSFITFLRAAGYDGPIDWGTFSEGVAKCLLVSPEDCQVILHRAKEAGGWAAGYDPLIGQIGLVSLITGWVLRRRSRQQLESQETAPQPGKSAQTGGSKASVSPRAPSPVSPEPAPLLSEFVTQVQRDGTWHSLKLYQARGAAEVALHAEMSARPATLGRIVQAYLKDGTKRYRPVFVLHGPRSQPQKAGGMSHG